jgi:hypothetical protein
MTDRHITDYCEYGRDNRGGIYVKRRPKQALDFSRIPAKAGRVDRAHFDFHCFTQSNSPGIEPADRDHLG